MAPRHRQAFAGEALALVELGLVGKKQAARGQTFRDVGARRAGERLAALERLTQQLVTAIQVAELLIDGAEGLVEVGLDGRLRAERAGLLHAAIDQRRDQQFVRRPGLGIAALEEIQDELLDPLGARRLRHRVVARAGQPNRVEGDEG